LISWQDLTVAVVVGVVLAAAVVTLTRRELLMALFTGTLLAVALVATAVVVIVSGHAPVSFACP
jgi:hypothetical protein